jgi:hypothetical protein
MVYLLSSYHIICGAGHTSHASVAKLPSYWDFGRFMTPFVLVVVLAGCSYAEIRNVTVSGTTATQAVVTYTPPDTSICSIAVSETADPSGNPQAPLVHDVDPNLFSGADQDNRAGNLANNGTRVFVIGTREAEKATDGRYYSRALQANTLHYGKITCGGSTALFTFRTTNIPLGIGYSDPWPTDSSHPGEWAVPSSPGSIGEKFIEPQTGAQIVRMTYPGFGWHQHLNQPFDTAYNQGQLPCDKTGPWTNTCDALASRPMASVGNSTAWLVLRNNDISFGYGGTNPTYGFTLTQFQVTLRASATESGKQLDVCLSMNAGASCASPIQIVDLPRRTGTIKVGVNNPGAIGIDPWLFDSNPHISRWEASTAQGKVTVSGTTAARSGGAYFSNSWTTGGSGRIRLSTVSAAHACSHGTEISIASGGGSTLTLASAPGDGSYYYCAPNFAVMVRRHDDGAGNVGTVRINNAKFATVTGDAGGNAGTGSANICATSLVQGGYLCMIPVAGGAADLSWTDLATGTTNMLGALQLNGKSTGTDQWNNYRPCPPGSPATFSTIDDTQTSIPTWFCVTRDKAGKPVVFQIQYTGPLTAQSFQNESGIGTTLVSDDDYSATYTNAVITDLTPSSLGKDVLSQINAFSGQTIDPDMACHNGPVQQGKFLIYCYYKQDSLGWFAVFDPGDRNPAHAGKAGGPRIVGTMSSWNGGPGAANRWAAIHAATDYGCCSGYFGFSASSIWAGSNGVGHTAVIVTTNDAIPGAGTDCATYGNPMGLTGPNCTLININAEEGSYEPYYWISVGTQGQTPGVPSDAQVGDLFCVTDNVSSCRAHSAGAYNPSYPNGSRETVQLIQKNANGQWVFLRNAASLTQGIIALPGSGTKYLVAESGAITTAIPYPGHANGNGMLGGNVFWDYAHDPLGQHTIRDPQFYDEHASTRPHIAIEVGSYPFKPWPANYRVRHAASLLELFNSPVNLVASNPSFHGINGPAISNVWQSHPCVAGDNSTAYESQAAFDLRPLEGFYSTAPNNADLYVNVAGQLWAADYKASDPDTLSGGSITLNRKIFPTAASSGMHPLIDVSGPGSVIDGTATYSYKYCIVRVAGECFPKSTAGQIYVNAPGVVFPFCQGNKVSGQTIPEANDICIANMPAAGDGLIQFSTLYPDPKGAYGRVLVKTMGSKVKAFIGTGGLMPLPSGWIAFNANYLDNLSRQDLLVKLPPFPESDGLDRSTFLSMPLKLKPPPGLGVTNAIVEFGYQEFAGYCTTRHETCIADEPAVGPMPFYFSEENPPGAPCSTGCTIAIPAVSQRVLYYQVKYRDASNHVVAATPLELTATP